MADKTDSAETEPLERHLFSAGGDKISATAKLEGLLSDADLDAPVMRDLGPEDGDPDSEDDDAPDPADEEDEQVEESDDDDEVADPLDDEDEDDDSEEDEEEEEPEDSYTVMVDGKEHEVSLEDLTQSYSFRAHNTQTSQELAASRKELETETVEVRQSREVYGQRLQQVEQALASLHQQEPDWDKLEAEDPARFATESAKWERHHRKIRALHAEQQRVFDEQVADETKQLNEYKAGQQRQMMEAIPEWADEKVHTAEQQKLYAYARNTLGFSEEEVNTILDHRSVVALRKAMLFDELQAKGRKKVKKGKKPTKTLKPGTRQRRKKKAGGAEKARRQLAKSGRMRDAESALFDLLDDDDL